MRIIKHGECLKFVCGECGCIWLANKSECKTQHHDSISMLPDWGYSCPDCGHWTSTRQEVRGEGDER